MAATRRVTPGPAHVCGPGCPGKAEPRTDTQARQGYEHHGPELEAQLVTMLAARKRYGVEFRPRWWWLLAPAAEPYRTDPSEFEDPRDFTTSTVQLEGWVRESLRHRQVEACGRLRFLVRHRLLEPWEELSLLSRGGLRAKVVKEELAARGDR